MAKTRSMSKILKSTDQSFHCYRGTKEKAPYIEEAKKRRAKQHEDFLKIRKGEICNKTLHELL
ncbi:putative non-inhibitory serpin-Z9 [Bienertia sinuspersici]